MRSWSSNANDSGPAEATNKRLSSFGQESREQRARTDPVVREEMLCMAEPLVWLKGGEWRQSNEPRLGRDGPFESRPRKEAKGSGQQKVSPPPGPTHQRER